MGFWFQMANLAQIFTSSYSQVQEILQILQKHRMSEQIKVEFSGKFFKKLSRKVIVLV